MGCGSRHPASRFQIPGAPHLAVWCWRWLLISKSDRSPLWGGQGTPTLLRTDSSLVLQDLAVCILSCPWLLSQLTSGSCFPVGTKERAVTHSSCPTYAQHEPQQVALDNLFLTTPEAPNPPPRAPEAHFCSSRNFPRSHLPASNLWHLAGFLGSDHCLKSRRSSFLHSPPLFSFLLHLSFCLLCLLSLFPVLPPSLPLPPCSLLLLLWSDDWFSWPSELWFYFTPKDTLITSFFTPKSFSRGPGCLQPCSTSSPRHSLKVGNCGGHLICKSKVGSSD